jgi:very-short-patch-repair endonuclease
MMRGSQPWKANRARILRSNSTSAEEKLWRHLRDRHLGGFKFVRQSSIESYFVDFACRRKKLIVEVYGGTHGTPEEIARDRVRDQHLSALGYKIVRVQNLDVHENIDGVLAEVLSVLENRDD